MGSRAGHHGLYRNLELAVEGKFLMKGAPTGWGGSRNYGAMRNAAALLSAWTRGDEVEARTIRTLWMGDQRDQLVVGHWAHRGGDGLQNECMAPAPHDLFDLAPTMVVWREALKRGDLEVAALAEAEVARQVALCRALSAKGIVCSPCGRAKTDDDPSNGSGADQWRSRLYDSILATVDGGKKFKYSSLATVAFAEILARPEGPAIRARLRAAELPKVLALPIHKAELGGGTYLAWIDDTPEARKQLGHDALSWVRWGPGMKEPDLGYDWAPLPAIGAAPVRTIGAERKAA